jgi:death-on-curing protein
VKGPRWLLPEVVLALHERLLADFGGPEGVRDPGLLESALARPRNISRYRPASIHELAAAYAFGIVKNHPFVDGNKRVGFAVAVLFLELNGYRFDAAQADAAVHTLALAAGDLSEHGFATWLRANSRRAARLSLTPKVARSERPELSGRD